MEIQYQASLRKRPVTPPGQTVVNIRLKHMRLMGRRCCGKSEMTFQQRSPVSWWTGSADYAPPNDPRLVETVTTTV